MNRIAEPKVVVSDGGAGFRKALKRKWPKVKHQRCVFHVFSQVKRYTTSRPNTLAGLELYALAKDLFDVKSVEDSKIWVNRFTGWIVKHKCFLSEVTYDENGNSRPKHERLIKAEKSILRLPNDNTLFTYLDEELMTEFKIPSTNNRIEGGVNACLTEHTGHGIPTIVEKYGKAVFEIESNYIRCTIPFEKEVIDQINNKNVGLNIGLNVALSKTEKKVIELLIENPSVTSTELAEKLEVTKRTIERTFKSLKEKKMIERIGSKRDGNWIVVR